MPETLPRRAVPPDKRRNRKLTIRDFTFIGMGRDPQPPRDIPVSVDHDKWYAEAVANRWEEEPPDLRNPRPRR